jgi:hypothetical protein
VSVPPVPEDLFDHGFSDKELGDLWHQLIVELLDATFVSRTHENRRTYDAGCRGPLCSKAAREHSRRRFSSPASPKYVYIDAILMDWKIIAEARIARAQQLLLEALTAS